jgi:hypothetical protein
MYPNISPTDLYQEYQARVAKGVRQHDLASAAQWQPGRLAHAFARFEARFEAWLTAGRIYPARYEVAEGGQLA